MSKGDPVPPLSENAPKAGEVYTHYKGDNYRIISIALDTVEQDWVVVYEPLYESPIKLFTRPLREWHELVDYQGQQINRFTLII